MEDLAWSYPAEPVERAAVRFCEAVARWRGKPELETVCLLSDYMRFHLPYWQYKKKSPSSSGISIDTLVHSSPVLPSTPATTSYSLASLGSMLGQHSQPVQPVPTLRRPRRQGRKPTIDVYFYGVSSRVGGTKRGRDERELEGREEGAKRMHM
jgi:hypothetical protein